MVDGSDLAGAADDGLLAVGVVDDGNLAAFFEARGAQGMGDRWQRAKSERAKISTFHERDSTAKSDIFTPETRCWKPLVRRKLTRHAMETALGGRTAWSGVCRYFTRHMWPTSHLVPLCARVLNAPPRLTHHHPRPSFITDSLAAL